MKKTLFLLLFSLLQAFHLSATEKIRIACVGNSVTYGAKLENRIRDAYPAQLQRLLGEKYEVGNFGHSGTTLIQKGGAAYTRTPTFQKALDFKADIVIIHLGLNDTSPSCWGSHSDDFIPNYQALIDTFRSVNPEAQIWICRMTPIFQGHKRFDSCARDWHAQIQRRIEQIARTYPTGLIDFYEPLHHRPELFPDALHPNAEGAGILAQKVYSAITGNYGGLQLPTTYGDHMVIQREKPILLTGIANAGETVTVHFGKQEQTAIASEQGRWEVTFPAQAAGGPYTLSFKAKCKKISFKDVWVGEVWLCSGQSNMFFQLKSCKTAQEDIALANQQEKIHLFNMRRLVPPAPKPWSLNILDSINHLNFILPGSWVRSNARDAAEFSAVAYHFGRALADSLNCHIGVICNAIGGSNIESWVDRTTLEKEIPNLLEDWMHHEYISPQIRRRGMANLKNSKVPLQRHPCEPCYLFESGILPLKDFALRGVVWYQGEANAENAELHARLFELLGSSWRKFWNDPQMPLHVVQLSSFNQSSWPNFRDSQRLLAQRIPNTWLTVSSDLGEARNIHYRNKRPLGERLANSALYHTYQRLNVIPSGPELSDVKFSGSTATLTFRYGEGLHPALGNELKGFEVAGADGIYHPALTQISKNQIYVYSKQVKEVQAVRYGWQPFSLGNLVNKAQLPCSTFRHEEFR